MGSPQGSEGKQSGLAVITCVGGGPEGERAAAFSDGGQVRRLVGVDFEKKSNGFRGAPASAGFTGLDERRTTQGTADVRRDGEARFTGSRVP